MAPASFPNLPTAAALFSAGLVVSACGRPVDQAPTEAQAVAENTVAAPLPGPGDTVQPPAGLGTNETAAASGAADAGGAVPTTSNTSDSPEGATTGTGATVGAPPR